ncbi:DUF1622 domain-containing protein [bacterium]|nr:MAG: DUF1622 domain-containing protein [bacterium]
MDGAEGLVHSVASWLRLIVETTGAAIVGIGFLVAAFRFVRESLRGDDSDFTSVRLILARYLALALEFQLGADILSTAIAPSWDQIGKLGAIAVIRTGLNYFLSKEMRDKEVTRKSESRVQQRDKVPEA